MTIPSIDRLDLILYKIPPQKQPNMLHQQEFYKILSRKKLPLVGLKIFSGSLVKKSRNFGDEYKDENQKGIKKNLVIHGQSFGGVLIIAVIWVGLLFCVSIKT